MTDLTFTTKTFAEVHFVIGPFDKVEVVPVNDRISGVDYIKAVYCETLYGYRFFDRRYTTIDGDVFESEPVNISEIVRVERYFQDQKAQEVENKKFLEELKQSWWTRLWDALIHGK